MQMSLLLLKIMNYSLVSTRNILLSLSPGGILGPLEQWYTNFGQIDFGCPN